MLFRHGWIEKRERARKDLSNAFSSKSGISSNVFLIEYYDASFLPSIGDFEARYIPDSKTLDEIFLDLSRVMNIPVKTVSSVFSRKETFPQFAERLLRAGAYEAR